MPGPALDITVRIRHNLRQMRPIRDVRTSESLIRSAGSFSGRSGVLFIACGLIAAGAVMTALAQPPTPVPAPSSTPPAPAAPSSAPGATDPSQPAAKPERPEVIVALRDGREVTGQIVRRDANEIVVRINGIDTPFPTSAIEDIRVLPPALERYRELRASIDDKDVQQLLTLVKWLQQRRLYEPALDELAHVLQLEPTHPEALSLRKLIESQILLDVKAGQGRPAGEAAPKPMRPIEPVFPLLSDDQVNLIKVFELDLADPPRMIVSRDTITQLVERYAGNPLIPSTRDAREALARERPEKILDLMFRVRARDLYSQVRVLDHPTPMRLFRDDVHRGWLVNSCATATCHGGQEAGRLWLYNRKPQSDTTVYTNFLILDRFRTADGKPLIDYNDPANSPLLQMALPREDSLYPHPRIETMGRGRDWRQVFGSTDDRKFLDAVAWINALYRPRPEYPISYKPPVPSAAAAKPAPNDAAPGER